jgi:hypothetical protein
MKTKLECIWMDYIRISINVNSSTSLFRILLCNILYKLKFTLVFFYWDLEKLHALY